MQDISPFLQRANILIEQGRAEDALKQVQEAFKLDPNNADVFEIMARSYYALRQYEKGINAIKQAIAIEPEEGYYHYLLGFGYFKQDDIFSAQKSLDESIALEPYFAEPYGLKACVYNHENKFDDALATANEGLEIDPENILCLNQRSVALNKLSRTDQAIETMQSALSIAPEDELTHCTVAWNYLEKGNHKLAKKHFKEALRIDPNYHSAQEGLKESLKSIIAPYRWMLQYSFWLSRKGKNFRVALPIALYILVRVLGTIARHNDGFKIIGMAAVGIYLLFIITSWVIEPIANFFLIFHKDGKYALTATERFTSISIVTSLILGIVCAVFAASSPNDSLQTNASIAAIGLFFLCVPLGRIEYPISFNKYDGQNRFGLIVSAIGIVSVIGIFFTPLAMIGVIILFIAVVINSWTGIFRG